MKKAIQIIILLLYTLFSFAGKAQRINPKIDSLIHLLTTESYRSHFDSLRTDTNCSRKVIKQKLQSADHDACRDYIYRHFQYYLGRENTYLHRFETGKYQGLANIIGFKKGLQTEAGIWVIGAHYDSNNTFEQSSSPQTISPGANDNATGVAALLELARIVAGLETKASIIFAAWDFEEVFTNGKATGSSTWFGEYVTKKKPTDWANIGNRGTIKHTNLVANINFDMFGNPQQEEDGKPLLWACYATSNDIDFVEYYATILNTYVPEIKTKTHGKLIYSDHYTFSSQKIKSVENLESNYLNDPFYHTYSDNLQNPDNIDMSFAASVARGGLAFLLENVFFNIPKRTVTILNETKIKWIEHPEEYIIPIPEGTIGSVKIIDCYGNLKNGKQHDTFVSFSPSFNGLYTIIINKRKLQISGTVNLKQKERPVTNEPFQ